MQKNSVTVIDVGSSCITAAAAERGINNTFVIKGFSRAEYAGFMDGTFLDVAELSKAVANCLKQISENLRKPLETVYVGVPGEFTTVILREWQQAFGKNKRITESDLDELYNAAFDVRSKRYSLINRSGIYFTLDDMRRVADPIGVQSKLLRGSLSYVLCDNNFINTFTPLLKKCGVENIEYVSSALAESLYLFEPETRDRTALLLDVGYLTASFSIISGDGIIYQKGLTYGGGYITATLTEMLDVDFDVAEKLKRRINLSFSTGEGSVYEVIDGDKEYEFPAKKVNDIVLFSLDELCENIDACLRDSGITVPEYVPLSLTGGGISYMRGAKEHISGRLNLVVETLAPSLPYMNKPTDSSLAALLDLALGQPVKKKGFFSKFFK